MPCLFNLARFHLPKLTLYRCSRWSECCPPGVLPFSGGLPLTRRGCAEDKVLVPSSVTCSVAVKLAWVMCSARGSGSTALTALGGPLTPWDSLRWTYTGILGWGWICFMQILSKSKSFFAAVCFGGRLILLQYGKLLGAGDIPAHTPCCSWLPSPAAWEKVQPIGESYWFSSSH